MIDHYYLFPEKPETNPASFLRGATVSEHPFKIEGYKLYAFLDCLDEADMPFWVAPIPTPGKIVSLYQFKFQGEPPDFEKYGMKLHHTVNGDVIFMPPQQLVIMSAKYRSISVKSGHWPDVCNLFHQLAAFSHLDIISRLSRKHLRNPSSLAELNRRFHQLYDVSDTVSSTLPTLYKETQLLLKFFCFSPPEICSASSSSSSGEDQEFYFGSLKESIKKFNLKCFPSYLIGRCCITPATVRQLRAMMRFVRIAMSKIGSDPGDDSLNLISRVNKFQRENNLKEGGCDSQTMQLLWRMVLSKSSDPITALTQAKVSLNLDAGRENDKFGIIDGKNCGEVGQKFADGFTKVVSQLPAPSSVIALAQKTVLGTAREAAKEFQEVGNGVSALQVKLKGVMKFANDVKEEAAKASERAEASIRIVDGLDQMNNEVSEKVALVKGKLEKEIARTNLFIVVFLLLAVILIAQWIGRKKGIQMLKYEL